MVHDGRPKEVPFLFSQDAFVVCDNADSGRRKWCIVTRTVGGRGIQREEAVLCGGKSCRDNKVASSCRHVTSVVAKFPVPATWEPGTLECSFPTPAPGGQHAFRNVTRVHLLHEKWQGQPVDEPNLDVRRQFAMVLAVLSDFEGSFRIVQG